jgi:hypothetical protein
VLARRPSWLLRLRAAEQTNFLSRLGHCSQPISLAMPSQPAGPRNPADSPASQKRSSHLEGHTPPQVQQPSAPMQRPLPIRPPDVPRKA